MIHRRGLMFAGIALVLLLAVGVGTRTALDARVVERCDDWRARGVQAIGDGDWKRALDALGRAVSDGRCAASRDARSWFDFARARVRVRAPALEHLRVALAALETARKLDPLDAEVGLSLAELRLGIGDAEGAVRAARRVVEYAPGTRGHRVLATALVADGQDRALVSLLDAEHLADSDFWFRALRIELAQRRAEPMGPVLAAMLALEPSPSRALLLSALAENTDPVAVREQLARYRAELTGSGTQPSADALGVAVRLHERVGAVDELLSFLRRNRSLLTDALELRALRLASQAGDAAFVSTLVEARRATLATDPEFVLQGALAGHAGSLMTLRSPSDDDSPMAARWRALGIALVDGAGAQQVAAAVSALRRTAPSTPLLDQIAAQAWLQLGERQRAEQLARGVRAVERHWSLPRATVGFARESEALARAIRRGRVVDACAGQGAGRAALAERVDALLACHGERLGADAAPVRVLSDAVDTSLALGDAALHGALVARLRHASPPGAMRWQLEHARSLLAGMRGGADAGSSSEAQAAQAAVLLRRVLDETPAHEDAALLMASARLALADVAGARAQLTALLRRAPERLAAVLGVVEQGLGDVDAAQAGALVALGSDLISGSEQGTADGIELELGWLERLLSFAEPEGNGALEIAVYERMIELDPTRGFALNNHAWLLLEAGEGVVTALDEAQRAVALEPANAAFRDTLTRVDRWSTERDARRRALTARAASQLEVERARAAEVRRRGSAGDA